MNISKIILKNNNKNFNQLNKRFTSKVAVELDNNLIKKLENKELKPRHHPGILNSRKYSLPEHIIKGIINCIGDYPVKSLITDGNKFTTYFKARHPPAENVKVRNVINNIEKELEEKFIRPDFQKMSEIEVQKYKQKREQKIKKILKERIFAWKPIEYNSYKSLCYAVARSAQEYSILLKIFKEIEQRDEKFKPKSFFDFGSGVGTGMWAASTLWKNSIFEYFNCDSSNDMNELSDLILREGYENKEKFLKNVFYRQFLPVSQKDYDLVISSFSLFELKSKRNRAEVLLNLWKKCIGYFVIVEEGTRNGFELVNEAKDLILELKEDSGHVFSPCPHDKICPRILNKNDNTPCNFEIIYKPIPLSDNKAEEKGIYSYIVLKKGERDEHSNENWPRLIRPTLVRARHTICRMCTAKGNLEEIIFTASKHGKLAYKCARSSKWGDRLPISKIEKEINQKE